VSQQDVVAGPHQLAAIATLGRQPLRIRRPLPLFDETDAMIFKRRGQRAHRLLQRRMMPLPDTDGQRKLQPGGCEFLSQV
jgi:hypothetical protein